MLELAESPCDAPTLVPVATEDPVVSAVDWLAPTLWPRLAEDPVEAPALVPALAPWLCVAVCDAFCVDPVERPDPADVVLETPWSDPVPLLAEPPADCVVPELWLPDTPTPPGSALAPALRPWVADPPTDRDAPADAETPCFAPVPTEAWWESE